MLVILATPPGEMQLPVDLVGQVRNNPNDLLSQSYINSVNVKNEQEAKANFKL